MGEYKQENRILSFTSALGLNKLLALNFRGTEEVSELFAYEAELLSESDVVVKASALVGKRVTMELQVTPEGTKRPFNGIVASFEALGGDDFFNKYRVKIVPMMWLLSLNRQTRVFQDQTVLDIVRKVLEPYSIMPRVETQGSYPVLEYCTQYRETDLEFVERLLEQHGIFFYFSHSKTDHVLVLSDTSNLCAECAVESNFDFQLNTATMLDFYKPLVLEFRSCSTLIAGKHSSWEYRFMKYALSHATPPVAESNTEMGENAHELYDYADSAAAFFKTEIAESKTPAMQTRLQSVERDAMDAQSIQCEGLATANTMEAGFTFTLQKYPQSEMNAKYLLTRVVHEIQQRPGYRAGEEWPEGPPYRNSFEARPFTQVFRKARKRIKPRVHGVVTGKVVTHPGEDSYLDRFGRVCVQFWWDRHRPEQTPDKTLLRVAQQWAGKGWGTYFWPRVGDEVLIDFIEGDPDAPIVVGSVYNGLNLPKYDPKDEYTRSGILTRSSKGGGAANANELRFDDRTGAEQIFINAERDFDLHVEHDWHTRVDHEEHREVARNQYHSVGGHAQLSIAEGQRLEVGQDRRISVGGMQTETIATALVTEVGQRQVSNTGLAHTIQAGGEIHVHGKGAVILQTEGLLFLMIDGVSLAITAVGLEVLANLLVGELMPPPIIPSFTPPPALPARKPDWPGDDPRG